MNSQDPPALYRPIVAVMGGKEDSFQKAATRTSRENAPEELGKAVAKRGWNLLTGGGSGAMQKVTAAYNKERDKLEKKSVSLAMLPKGQDNTANADKPIKTGLPGSKWNSEVLRGDSRNHLNVRLADLIVVLPGLSGTQSELTLAVYHQKPCVAFLRNEGDRIGKLDDKTMLKLGARVAKTIDDIEEFFDDHRPRKIKAVKKGR